jgi:hypothetical protein
VNAGSKESQAAPVISHLRGTAGPLLRVQERVEYYRNPDVRARILEFLGGNGRQPTCHYLTAGDENAPHLDRRWVDSALDALLEHGFEIFRSLWDETSLVADFDVEYVNFDHPAEAFVDPERIFELQQPVAETIRRLLRDYQIVPLHLLSGRGHHFVWHIRRDSEEFKRLVDLGRGPDTLWSKASESHRPEGKKVPEELARAFAGLGLIMEFLAYQVKEIAAPASAIPVELTALETGPSDHGREMISLDISEYGDPLHIRMMRVPFSVYLKPWQQSWGIDTGVLSKLQPLFVVPLPELSWRQGIEVMRDQAATIRLAKNCRTRIPDASASMARLIADYADSNVAKFHTWFYSQEPQPPERWSETYDRLSLDVLPVCARTVLEQPNDLLLRPARIRQLVRVMLALGWHPRHISGLIHSKYARPFGWTQLAGYDPATRADFYTRIFAGLFVTGRDDLVDFNCVSAQEQKVCPFSQCECNLLDFKQSALNRRAHDKLAHRPFNRLLLQPEHS